MVKKVKGKGDFAQTAFKVMEESTKDRPKKIKAKKRAAKPSRRKIKK